MKGNPVKMETHRYVNRTEYVTGEDGAHWREATPVELMRILDEEPEHRVIVNHGEPCPASKYAGMYLAGSYPFLPGICHLMPVYVEVTCVGAA
jgi:hypothetical protein